MPWKPQTRSRHQYEERRLYGGHLLKPGKLSPAAIAREGRGSRAAVCQWAHRLTGHPNRLPALTAEPVPGRPARLADKQWQALLKFLSNGALVAGVEPDRWTLPRSRAGVCRHCGAEYHPRSLGRQLRVLGWSRQVPAPQARQRDPALVAAWLKRDWPQVKKRLAAAGHRASALMKPAAAS
jgi:transposase